MAGRGLVPDPLHRTQVNRGKHGSRNRALTKPAASCFLTLDSDDKCPPNALERLECHWQSIPPDIRDKFSGVSGHTSGEDGAAHGTRFPFDPTDSDSLEIRFKYKVKGEKWGFQRTDVMREFPLPEIDGYAGLMPSSIGWNAIARKYKTRYVNETSRPGRRIRQRASVDRPIERLMFPGN